MNTLSQFNLEDETGSMRLSRSGAATTSPTYLTIQGIPRRPRSYLQLENNLRNLFDAPSLSPPPPSSTPPPAIHEPTAAAASQRHRSSSTRSRNSN